MTKTRHVSLLCALSLSFLASHPAPAGAWGRVGHETVALIAQSRLSPEALAKVHELLGEAGLDAVANCADVIRNAGTDCGGIFYVPKRPETEGWHFIDIPVGESPGAGDLEQYCRKDGSSDCAVDQITANLDVLKNPSSVQADKQTALMFVVHFMGDLHQPLHCATEFDADGQEDRGGNLKPITFTPGAEAAAPDAVKKHPMNLHHLWDNVVMTDEAEKGLDAASLAESLGSQVGDQAPDWISSFTPAGAALESFAIAKGAIYPAYHAPRGSQIGPDYEARMQPVAYQQIEKAGVRLAAVLESALTGR